MTRGWSGSGNSSGTGGSGATIRVARTRMARGEGGVRNYAEARPRAANGARAVAVRSGRRTMRVSELVGRMLGNLCRRAKEAG